MKPLLRSYQLRALVVLSLFATVPLGTTHAAPQNKPSIGGLITDANGAPVGGAEVYIYTSSNTRRPADFISQKTEGDGRYQVVVPPGKYWVVARIRRGEPYGPLMPGDKHSGPPEQIVIKPGSETLHNFIVADLREAALKARKTRENYFTISGRIISADGNPIAGQYVMALRKKKTSRLPDFISGWTDMNGRYLLYVPKGRYWIAAAAQFPAQHILGKTRRITVKSDVEEFDIEENDSASH